MATGRDGIPGVPVAGGVVEEFKLALGPAQILHHPSEALTVKASLWNEGRATRTNALNGPASPKTSASAPKSGQVQTRFAQGYSRDLITLLGKITYFAHRPTRGS